jgi:hypothetical protein
MYLQTRIDEHRSIAVVSHPERGKSQGIVYGGKA